jgi:RNA polymerase sigma-70 factor (ECF subfamily)
VAASLANLLEQFRPRIYRWARIVLGHHHDAQDVTQEVLLRLVRAAGTDNEPTRPEAWLRRVTYNAAIDRIRQKRPAALPAEPALRAANRSTADASAIGNQLREQIVAALARVSESQRLVLCAKVFDGMTFAQIAEQMDLAVPTVKTHYLRAVRALRTLLAEHGWEDTNDGMP